MLLFTHKVASNSFATPWTIACQAPPPMGFFSGKNTGVGCHFLLQGIFLTQGSNLGLLCCRQTLKYLGKSLLNKYYLGHLINFSLHKSRVASCHIKKINLGSKYYSDFCILKCCGMNKFKSIYYTSLLENVP